MSEKKYDLSKVSQATKDEYCQARIDFEHYDGPSVALHRTAKKLCSEAEVKPKTAREILEEARRSVSFSSTYAFEDRESLLEAIDEALKVLP